MGDKLTCREGEGDQVREEIAGEVSLALMQRGCYFTADLLRQLRANHGGDTLSCLLGHLCAQRQKYIHEGKH